MASDGRPDLVLSSKDVLLRLNSPTQNLICAYDGAEDPYTLVNSQCISWPVFPFKYKYRITAQYSTFDEKLAFASLAMFVIQYLMSEWHDKSALSPSGLKHVLKQGMKILGVSVSWKWDRLVTYWLALVTNIYVIGLLKLEIYWKYCGKEEKLLLILFQNIFYLLLDLNV